MAEGHQADHEEAGAKQLAGLQRDESPRTAEGDAGPNGGHGRAKDEHAPAKQLAQQARPPPQPAGLSQPSQRQEGDGRQEKKEDAGNFAAVGDNFVHQPLIPTGRRLFRWWRRFRRAFGGWFIG